MKTQKDFEPLVEYIKQWELQNIKPKNEKVFLELFTDLINNYPDDREVEFDGDGAYYGKQVTLKPFSYYGKTPKELSFEVSYCDRAISIYSANHQGFWHPEYVYLKSGDPGFIALLLNFKQFLTGVFGL